MVQRMELLRTQELPDLFKLFRFQWRQEGT